MTLASPLHSAPTVPAADRERQRVEHLVHGRPRPPIDMPRRPKDVSKQEWKVRRGELRKVGVTLAPGIEERVRLREDWSHKAEGTPETHHHAERAQRAGSLARLVATGALDIHQLAAAEQITAAYEATVAEVAVRTARYEQRGSGGGPLAACAVPVAAVLREQRYDRWRAAVGADGQMLLAIIIDDMPLTAAARRWRKSNRSTRAILVRALDGWGRC